MSLHLIQYLAIFQQNFLLAIIAEVATCCVIQFVSEAFVPEMFRTVYAILAMDFNIKMKLPGAK